MLVKMPPAGKPKLLDQVRDILRCKRYSIRTEQAYIDWIKRFIIYHGKRHPGEMAEEEVADFLTDLAFECQHRSLDPELGVERVTFSVQRGAPA
jgi:hypothetical protein